MKILSFEAIKHLYLKATGHWTSVDRVYIGVKIVRFYGTAENACAF